MAKGLFTAALVALLPVLSTAVNTTTYDLDISWMTASPNGVARSVIGVNGQWPPPTLYATKGDQLVVNVVNNLGNQSTSLHFHGMFQNGTTNMDGSVGASQCPIPAGAKFTYNFTLSQSGSYWYHSHLKGQYPEGLRAPFIIRDPDMPFTYDEELSLSISDWYNTPMPILSEAFLSVTNPGGAEPVPDAVLMNDTQALGIKVQPGKTYFLRLVNLGAFAATRFWIEGHTMRVVEVDGVFTEPKEANILYMAVAQRMGILVTTKNDTSANFPMVVSMDEDLFDTVPPGLNPNNTGWLVYDDTKPKPDAKLLSSWDDFDEISLVPSDGEKRYATPDMTVTLNVKMGNLGDGANYAFFNDVTYVSPKVPTVFSAMTLGDAAANASVYGVNSNAYVLKKGDVVELIVNNQDTGKHPFHLHGHNFQIVERAKEESGDAPVNPTDAGLPDVPVRRDTLSVWPNSYARLRFVADNPGIWLFHCHIEWHTISGLIATMIEAPLEMQKVLQIPEDQYSACKALNIPTAGNAAGNTQDPYDLKGANVSPAPLPAGFTARGIVALVFSVIAALLGCAVIAWYGYAPVAK